MINFVDLFAGIGGIRIGLEQSFGKENVSCVCSSEKDKFAIQAYNHHFNDNSDIVEIDAVETEKLPNIDILMAGFPCQPFSKAGKEEGFNDEDRGVMFFKIIDMIKKKKPPVVFLENVSSLKTHDKGNTLQVILSMLKKEGYNVFYDILNSKDFGLPQNRKRIYFVCFLDHSIDFKFPVGEKIETRISDILENEVDPKYTISDRLWNGFIERKKRNKLNGKGFGYQLFNENSSYGATITARYGKDGCEVLIEQKDKNPRRLTPTEAKRYQGFPDDFEIIVSNAQAYKQFGNSVSVPVIKSIFDEIKKYKIFDRQKLM